MIEHAITATEAASLRADMARAHQETLGAIALIGDERWTLTPRDGGWSAAQISEHILIVENALMAGVRAHLDAPAGDTRQENEAEREHMLRLHIPSPPVPLTAPPALAVFEGLTIEQVSLALDRSRLAYTTLLKQCQSSPMHAIVWDHPFIGPLNGFLWLLHVPLHTVRHNGQLARLAW